jgi:ankyrin repeat protein
MSKVIFFLSLFSICFNAYSKVTSLNNKDSLSTFELNELLLYAVYEEKVDSVRTLINLGADANSVDYRNNSALIYAAQSGNEEITKSLLNSGAEVNHKGYLKRTALFEAARFNHFHIAELLILNNAEIDADDYYGNTALYYAIANANFFFADMLIFYGADVNYSNKRDRTPLHTACWYGQVEIAGLLIEAGADIDAIEMHGNTPLIISVMTYNIEMAWYLIESGADIVSINNEFHDIFSIAAYNKDYELFDFLASYNVKPEDYPDKYKSPYGIYILKNDKQLKSLISPYKEFKPKGLYFTHFLFEPTFHFNTNEFMFGVQAGILESRFGFGFLGGFQSRITPKRVLVHQYENLYNQYWEDRKVWHVSIFKKHNIFNNGNVIAGIQYGVKGAYTYGSYSGSSQRPDSKFLAIPYGGLFIGNNWIRLNAGYDYMNYGQQDIPVHRFSIGAKFMLPLFDIGYRAVDYSVF